MVEGIVASLSYITVSLVRKDMPETWRLFLMSTLSELTHHMMRSIMLYEVGGFKRFLVRAQNGCIETMSGIKNMVDLELNDMIMEVERATDRSRLQ